MMKNKVAQITVLLLLLTVPAMAIDLPSSELGLKMQSVKYAGLNNAGLAGTDEEMIDDEFNIGFEDDASIYEYDYRSPKKAFLYSLLIPGWGQKYTQSPPWKTILFLGLEAGMWVGYFSKHNDGNKMTDEYEAYADEHWFAGSATNPASTPETYRGWLATYDSSESNFSHSLPDTKSQQYYEMIGKYDQFRGGWDDYWLGVDTDGDGVADTEGPIYHETLDTVYNSSGEFDYATIKYISANRLTYNNMRADANDLLNQANQFIVFSIVNHLLSALDAALAANRYNKQKAADMWLTFRVDQRKYSATEEIPIIRATVRF